MNVSEMILGTSKTSGIANLFWNWNYGFVVMIVVTYHTYCPGCDDKHYLALLTFPTPTDCWETPLVQLYWNSTKISNSTIWLSTPLFHKTTLLSLTVKSSLIILDPLYMILQSSPLQLHSFFVILLCFYLFQSPNSVVTKLGLFPLSYFITHLF